ncbi:MAG: hypothetical protein QJR02_01875 [Sinobacteraceae bacterium]|nr:hypothetical protein [Nevskiaceae bacterium]
MSLWNRIKDWYNPAVYRDEEQRRRVQLRDRVLGVLGLGGLIGSSILCAELGANA